MSHYLILISYYWKRINYGSLKLFILLPFWQFPRSENTVPSGQTHATVLVGKVSDTTHFWFPVHGLFIWHGF